MPSSRAATATPWAWLPALAATTPRLRSASSSDESRVKAPRSLNEPARCRFSHLSNTVTPATALSEALVSIGVRDVTPMSSSRAR